MGARKAKFGYQVDAVDGRLVLPQFEGLCVLVYRSVPKKELHPDKFNWFTFRGGQGATIKKAHDIDHAVVAGCISNVSNIAEVCAVCLESGIWLTIWAEEPSYVTKGFSEAMTAQREERKLLSDRRDGRSDEIQNLIGDILTEVDA